VRDYPRSIACGVIESFIAVSSRVIDVDFCKTLFSNKYIIL
jgi:hypothetical protein